MKTLKNPKKKFYRNIIKNINMKSNKIIKLPK